MIIQRAEYAKEIIVKLRAVLQLGFGKSMPTVCVWLEGIGEQVSEKFLLHHFLRFGFVQSVYVDRKTGRALVYYDNVENAQRAVAEMRGRTVADRRIQVCLQECLRVCLCMCLCVSEYLCVCVVVCVSCLST